MVKISKKKATFLIILSLVVFVLGAKYFLQLRQKHISAVALARTKGSPSAPIQIIEYIDFQCPACAVGAKYLGELIQKNPDKIHLEMRYFPLSKVHSHAMLSAMYAQCAAEQNKFWPFHDLLVERQANWKRLADAKPAFEVIAQEVGLNPAKLGACLASSSTTEKIEQDRQAGDALGIKSTPTYFINGQMVVGSQSLQTELQKLLPQGEAH